MRKQTEDLAGQRYGKLLVVERTENDKNNHIQYRCKCDCGNEVVVLKSNLKRNSTKSCGCLYKETRKTSAKTHGMSKTRLFKIWASMNARCNNPNNRDYKYYGGKGVRVCKEWQTFEKFNEWATQNGYSEELTIDRIDVCGNYNPENCRWVTRKVQANNTTRNHYVTHNGKTKTISEWAEETGVSLRTIFYRIRCGLTDEEAIFIVDRRKKLCR